VNLTLAENAMAEQPNGACATERDTGALPPRKSNSSTEPVDVPAASRYPSRLNANDDSGNVDSSVRTKLCRVPSDQHTCARTKHLPVLVDIEKQYAFVERRRCH
jgi:hypothetical protein